MQTYLVGGAVRDALLGQPVKDKDWVVVGATPAQLHQEGYTPVGQDFPVFLHPKTKEEYALARTERKSGKGYTGFTFHTSADVTLEQDLARRDLTINAIAEDSHGKLIDPYRGQQDLNNRILRHVSPAFSEDPLRVLRAARFAARFAHLGFSIAPSTLMLMRDIVNNGEIDHLVPERVWQEINSALCTSHPEIFFSVLRHCGALKKLLPELDNLFGVPQPKQHHPEIDTGVHALLSLKRACKLSTKPTIRFAALIHDLGKALTPKSEWPRHIAHESKGKVPIAALCDRLCVPNEHKQLALITSEFHTHAHRAHELNAKTVLKTLKNLDAFRRPERFADFLICCQADAQGRTFKEALTYTQRDFLLGALHAAQSVNVKHILAKNAELKGVQIGEKIGREQLLILKSYQHAQGR